MTTRAAVPVKGDFKKIIGGGFAFVGPSKVVGKNFENQKKSGVFNFPSGEAVENFEMFTSSIGPVTSGNYVLLRKLWKALSGGMLDLSTRKVFNINDRAVLDLTIRSSRSRNRTRMLSLYNMQNRPCKSWRCRKTRWDACTPSISRPISTGSQFPANHARSCLEFGAGQNGALPARLPRRVLRQRQNLLRRLSQAGDTERNIAHLSLSPIAWEPWGRKSTIPQPVNTVRSSSV